eukprot:scaffold1009_cov116-Skeletonema_dohrnii-CCMP3373.AAC.4
MMVVFVTYYHIDVIPPPVATARCYAATASNPALQRISGGALSSSPAKKLRVEAGIRLIIHNLERFAGGASMLFNARVNPTYLLCSCFNIFVFGMGTYHVNSDKMLNELRELKKVENDGDRYPHTKYFS